MTDFFNFAFLNDQLLNMGAVNSVADLQGMACGFLAGRLTLPPEQGEINRDQWRDMAREYMELQEMELGEDQLALFDLVLERTRKSLADAQLGFEPLLPEDDVNLIRRTEELGAWCQGFLHGLGRSGLKAEEAFSAEAAESLKDLARIAQVSPEVEELEENEVYFTELVEYVKVAVLTIHAELAAKAPKPDSTVH